jgi:hypothetical protein
MNSASEKMALMLADHEIRIAKLEKRLKKC